MGKHLEINTDLCMGCCACEIACKMENELPEGIRYIIMNQMENKISGKEKLYFDFSVCKQCDPAECMKICPEKAIVRNTDGIIHVEESKCIGCKLCKSACSYDIPQFGSRHVMQKCNLCLQRLEQGLLPSCVLACPANAIKVVE